MGESKLQMHGTTVLCVRRDNKVVIAADGQVTMGQNVMKHTARKTRRLFNDKVLAGFAGPPPTRSRFLSDLRASCRSTTEIWPKRRWNWPRSGAKIAPCGTWRRC